MAKKVRSIIFWAAVIAGSLLWIKVYAEIHKAIETEIIIET